MQLVAGGMTNAGGCWTETCAKLTRTPAQKELAVSVILSRARLINNSPAAQCDRPFDRDEVAGG